MSEYPSLTAFKHRMNRAGASHLPTAAAMAAREGLGRASAVGCCHRGTLHRERCKASSTGRPVMRAKHGAQAVASKPRAAWVFSCIKATQQGDARRFCNATQAPHGMRCACPALLAPDEVSSTHPCGQRWHAVRPQVASNSRERRRTAPGGVAGTPLTCSAFASSRRLSIQLSACSWRVNSSRSRTSSGLGLLGCWPIAAEPAGGD